MPPKLIIYDLDNTLVMTRPAAKIGYQQAIYFIAKKHGLYRDRNKLYHHWKRLVHSLKVDPKPYKRRFAFSLGLLLDKHQLPHTHLNQALHLYEKTLLTHIRTAKGAKELLSSCHDASLKQVVTPGSDAVEAVHKLKAVSLYSLIDLLITAFDIGSMKPHSDYYLKPMAHFKVSPNQTVVIGDHQAEDIAPALKLGLTVYRVTPQSHLMEFQKHLF